VVDRPALEPHVPVVLQADLAVDHVRLSVIPRLTVAEAALGTMVVPERLDGLLNDGGHAGLPPLANCDLIRMSSLPAITLHSTDGSFTIRILEVDDA
jgi:hypothetical protein